MSSANIETVIITLASLLGLPVGADEPEAPAAPVVVTTRNGEDRVTARLHGDGWIFSVTSPRGIGGARITRRGGGWPRSLVLQMRLRGLERLQAGTGKALVTASVTSSGDHRIMQSLAEEGKGDVPIDRRHPLWMEIRANDGMFEVTLPQALVATNPATIRLDWIDFYR